MTQAAILAKAYDMYLERKLVHGDERLSLVLDSLGYTTGAGYQIWPNQAAFRLDLQVYIAESIDYASLEPIAEQLQVLRAQNLDREHHILAIGDLYHDYFSVCEEFFLVLRFYAMGDDRPPQVTEALQRSYTKIGAELEYAFTKSWETSNRQLKPGRTMGQLVATVTALAEGFALRERAGAEVAMVEIDGRSHHAFSVALLAVLDSYSEPI
jgi:hypothetical protein